MSEEKRSIPFTIKLIGLFTVVVLISSLISSEIIGKVARDEITMMNYVYGEENTAKYIEQAGSITHGIFFKSGIVEAVENFTFPKSYLNKNYGDDEFIPIQFWKYIDRAINNFLTSVQFSVLRLCSFIGWLPLFVLLMFGSVVSGYYQREIKKEGFEYSSPVRHGIAKKTIIMMPIFVYVIVLIPVAIHPWIIPIIVAFVSMFAGWFVSNTIKRI